MTTSNEHRLVLDARPAFGAEPIALIEVLGRPWLATFLDMVADSRASSRLTIVASPDASEQVRKVVSEHPRSQDTVVVTEPPSLPYCLHATTAQVYVRQLFIRAIKRRKTDFGNAALLTLTSPADMKSAEEFTSRDSYAEGRTVLLRYVYRPVARRLANALIPLGVTPNMVTLASLLLIPAAAVLTAYDSYTLAIAAAVLVQAIWVLDLIDGYLARLSGNRSNFGYWFDTMVDTMLDASMAIAFTIGVIVATGEIAYAIPGAIWIVGFAVTHGDALIQTAAGSEALGPSYAPVRPGLREKGGAALIWYLAGRLRWAIGQPDIVITIFTAGLLAKAELAVVILFAAYYAYSTLRMFASAYATYRRTELTRKP